ncbi:MAG: reactive intermediate/imine deaminase [Candidatus Azotimanducaceae bacterium]|jgi:reactive intermediate/imine deaminase
MKNTISTSNAPAAIGTYSQAVIHGNTLYISGQIALVPDTMTLVSENIDEQIEQVFDNLSAIAIAADTQLDDAIKFTVYLTDLGDFARVNEVMAARLTEPYPARVAVEVSALPKAARVEIDAIIAS